MSAQNQASPADRFRFPNLKPPIRTSFLFNLLDPTKAIDRSQALADLLSLTVLTALEKIKMHLSSQSWEKITALKNTSGMSFTALYSAFKDDDEKQLFLTAMAQSKNLVLANYFSMLLNSLPETKKTQLLTENSELHELERFLEEYNKNNG